MNISVLWFLVSFIKHKIKAGFLYLVRSHGRMELSKLSLKNYQMMGQKFKKKKLEIPDMSQDIPGL